MFSQGSWLKTCCPPRPPHKAGPGTQAPDTRRFTPPSCVPCHHLIIHSKNACRAPGPEPIRGSLLLAGALDHWLFGVSVPRKVGMVPLVCLSHQTGLPTWLQLRTSPERSLIRLQFAEIKPRRHQLLQVPRRNADLFPKWGAPWRCRRGSQGE